MRVPDSWDVNWMKRARAASGRSKDPRHQVGAIIVSPDNVDSYSGYNGFPSGLGEEEWMWARDAKRKFVVHAEHNAILKARQRVDGWTLYCTHHVCERCALVIAQAKIAEVVYENDDMVSYDKDLALWILTNVGTKIFRLVEGERIQVRIN